MVNFKVAIDGPAGSGKSSISNIVSKNLGFTHIDTGAMYRAVTLEALNLGINLDNEDEYSFVDNIEVAYINGKIYLNGKDVSDYIRTIEVTENVSTVSKFPIVRKKMVDFQRASAAHGLVLMDGRDIGSVVLKDADVKIFLTASPEERAKRRLLEFENKGEDVSYEEILSSIKERDYKDSTRDVSPLVQASDAILIDTTVMSIDEVSNKIIEIINERIKKKSMEKDLYSTNMVHVGQIIKGEVLSVTDRAIKINLDTFTEGTMYLEFYTLDRSVTSFIGLVEKGDIIECQVTKVNEERGEILLSRLNMAKKEAFALNQAAKDEVITVKVDKKVNKGFMTSCKGVPYFLPEGEALDAKQGDSIKVVVINMDPERGSGLVSARGYQRAIVNEERALEFSKINVGDVIEGEVSKIESYGAFVKFGRLQGLIRLREVDHKFIKNAGEILSVGDKVSCKILSLENGRIDLSRKALIESPFDLYVKNHKVSDTITVTVEQKMPFGVVCKLADDVNGLLHKSEFSWNPNDNLMASLKIGDELEVAIIQIDEDKKKISLSKKALIDNPWGRVNGNQGDEITIKISEITPKGLKFEALGVDGFVPSSEIVLDKNSSKLEDYYAEGDEVKAIISEIDTRNWVLKASIKKYQNLQERKQFDEFLEKQALSDEESVTTLGDIFKDNLK